MGSQPMADNAKRTGAAIEAHYQFLLWLGPLLEKFPKDKKFTIGDRIQNIALDILEELIEATYTRDRLQHLRRANLGIEKLRFLMRLAADLKVIDGRRYEFAARTLDEIGRSVGAWAKRIMPKRHDNLFGQIVSFGALRSAAQCAIGGKRKKAGPAAFFANLERELLTLERELQDGAYKPGRYFAFEVNDPKKRIVSAAPFRDRVVHHALCAIIQPIFETGFIDAYRQGDASGHSAL